MAKYHFECIHCGASAGDFQQLLANDRRCPECASDHLNAIYSAAQDSNFNSASHLPTSGVWRYFHRLPLQQLDNIISAGEGDVPLERWTFLEDFARESGVDCLVRAHRHDNNPATGSFKDLAGSVMASCLNEAGIQNVVVASTGNIGVAFARYLSAAGINLYVFIPQNSSLMHDAEIGMFGQKVFRVQGDYAQAKELAAEFAERHNFFAVSGGYDPLRIEAKKTIAYEWNRLLGYAPDVYVQALSGGMGPLGIAKGLRELGSTKTRFCLAQSDQCSPMADAWSDAQKSGWPDGWEQNYPVYENPQTRVATLATGRPGLYPLLAPLVQQQGGEIFSVSEELAGVAARLVAAEQAVRIGPAAAIAVLGFIKAAQRGYIRNGDEVIVAIGEGVRRSPEFMAEQAWSTAVSNVDECEPVERSEYIESLRIRLRD